MARVLADSVEKPSCGAESVFNDSLLRLFTQLGEKERISEIQKLFDTMGQFWEYSINNQFLILMQRPDATRVAGMKTWNKLGRRVNRGEKGISILVPRPGRKPASQSEIASGRATQDPKTGEWFVPRLYFTTGWVFDIAQTKGDPLPTHEPTADGDPLRAIAQMNVCAMSHQIKIEHVPGLLKTHGCWGCSLGGHIKLERDMTVPQFCAVYAHELAHEILHQQKNNGDSKLSELTTRAKELEAEATAYLFCRQMGVQLDNASSYLLIWSKANAEQAKRELFKSLERVKAAARVMLGLVKQSGFLIAENSR